MHRAGVLFLGLSLIVLPSEVRADPVDNAPLAAAAIDLGGTVLVVWTAGVQAAESYNVYGLAADGPPVLLDTFPIDDPQTAAASMFVAPGFALYGVSGVVGTIESQITPTTTASPPCVYVQPPYARVSCTTPAFVPGVPMRRSPLSGTGPVLHAE